KLPYGSMTVQSFATGGVMPYTLNFTPASADPVVIATMPPGGIYKRGSVILTGLAGSGPAIDPVVNGSQLVWRLQSLTVSGNYQLRFSVYAPLRVGHVAATATVDGLSAGIAPT